ncbi:hypothetical protein DIC66_08530 [Rhodoferax lacus]|uniref:DUF2306 domain-containing protein n=1 Tax=Rhodoferax lacus TaxID=2184758 RepID=A0A3E1RCU0_9BURK|nr:DUF2306 domain-containing protein [Rhodoferax lacus]RFO97178.1 hypothetical protein DIC66_08530 [Rhodoferax lacus]
MQNVLRVDWKIPLGLLALSAIPCAAGIARLIGLVGIVNADSERFLASPLITWLHIVAASLFCLLGALQFSADLRRHFPRWHQVAGRVVAASGVLAALSGMWMAARFAIPAAMQGSLLLGVRLVVGAAMAVAIVLAVQAALNRNMAAHRAWMVRAYALGQGAGTQVVLLLPWMLTLGPPSALQRDVLMSLAWLLNLLIAEKIIHGRLLGSFHFYKEIF